MNKNVKLTCGVDSFPSATKFTWIFNSTQEFSNVPKSRFTQEGNVSILTYKPISKYDYGTLLCYAENDAGKQKSPCAFIVLRAGVPSPVKKCLTSVDTLIDAFEIKCEANPSESEASEFLLYLYTGPGLDYVLNLTNSERPFFHLNALQPNTSFLAEIFARNSIGKSEVTKIYGVIPTVAERLTKTSRSFMIELSPVLGALIAIIILLVIMSVVLIIYMKICRKKLKRKRKPKKNKAVDKSLIYAVKAESPMSLLGQDEMSDGDRNPDVVPLQYGE